jgi:thioredoxin-like negative regulator of GroEL
MRNADAVKFTLIATLTLATASAGLAALWPTALDAARHQSTSLTTAAGQADGGEALVDYQLATWLNPANQTAYAGLARTQILAGRPDDALASLAYAGQGSEAGQLKTRTLIELSRYHEAAAESNHLTAPGRPDADVVLAGLSLALDGHPADIDPLMARVTAPEALQSLRRAQAGNLSLAAELYTTGLLQSSSAILAKQPESYERNLLLARIRYARHTATDLDLAIGYLNTAISLNPASTDARILLAQIYRANGQTDAAAHQDTAIAALKAGRP